MKKMFYFVLIFPFFTSCKEQKTADKVSSDTLEGTWQLISGTLIEKGDTTFTDYTRGLQMIKVVNDSHFAFLNHDLHKGKDSTASFAAGGGKYDLSGDQYTEHLAYCSDRAWEGSDFKFTISIKNDTLTQSGIEKVAGTGVDRMNIEKYVKVRR